MTTLVAHARPTRVVAYLLLAAAGVLVPPLQLLHFDLPGHVNWLWWTLCGFLVIGGGFAAFGQIVKRWTGEYVGLPLLWGALSGLGLLQWAASEWQWVGFPSAILLWSWALLLFARWRDVNVLVRAVWRNR